MSGLVLPSAALAATKLLMMGDSLTAGYRLKSSEALPVVLQEKLIAHGLEAEVINGGVSGDTTAGGHKRLEWMLEKHEPKLVFVALGGNDMLRGIDPAQVEYNLDSILYTLHQKGIKAILMQVTVPENQDATYAAQFNAIFPKLAQKYNIALYPFFLTPIFGHPDYMLDDGVHPNAKGIDYIAAHLADFFLKNGYF
jgi:acyl-CoA thioesterase I